MSISHWGFVFWVSGFVANLALIIVLLAKRRFVRFGVFTATICYVSLRTIALFTIHKAAPDKTYVLVYLWSSVPDYLLQIAIIAELCWRACQNQAKLSATTVVNIVCWCLLSTAIASVLCLKLCPPSLSTFELWDVRVTTFTSLVTCQCFLILATFTNHLGIRRSDHVLAIGSGLVLWSALALIGDAVCAAGNWDLEFPVFDHIREITYLAVTVYWAFALWREEKARTNAIGAESALAYLQSVEGLSAHNAPGGRMRAK